MQWYNAAHVQVVQGGTYQKQSNLNRCKIAGVNGVLTLSVPLIGGREQKALLKDVQIDNTQKWPLQHLRTLQSCYGKAPFFDYYFPVIEVLLLQNHQYLTELNNTILQQLIRWLQWKGTVEWSDAFQKKEDITTPLQQPYVQVFADRHPFQPNLSILDLLFCTGPQAVGYLRQKAAF